MTDPLLSVVVPTHNRSGYAISCIEAILAFPEPGLEVIVTDTSTDFALQGMLEAQDCSFRDDPRLHYVKINEASNLTKNHNAAMELATGSYVCLIGDDDCITHDAIEAARWAQTNNVPVVSQDIFTTYAWPDFRTRLVRGGHAGRLYIPRKMGVGRWRDAAADLGEALARSFQGTDHMPRCYHGIVQREILTEIRSETGTFFTGSSPDMSGAVALACRVGKYFESDIPLTIPGVSGGSNSGRSAMNTHKGSLSSDKQTSDFENAGWVEGVPKFFSVETVWAHAGLATLEKFAPSHVDCFNFVRLLALCGLRHPEFSREVDEATAEAAQRLGRDLTHSIAKERKKLRLERMSTLAKRLTIPTISGGRKYLSGKKNIAEASEAYYRYSTDLGYHFNPD